MQIQTLVNVKYQVVIPKEVRRKIKIQPGQKMDIDMWGEKIVLTKAKKEKKWKWPDDYYKNLGGIWKSSEDIEKYLEEEDKSWK